MPEGYPAVAHDRQSAADDAHPEDHQLTGSPSDFDAIEAAVMETARGRWFLAEYARRNRSADTLQLLQVLERIEKSLADGKLPTAKPVRSETPFAVVAPPTEDSGRQAIAGDAAGATRAPAVRTTMDMAPPVTRIVPSRAGAAGTGDLWQPVAEPALSGTPAAASLQSGEQSGLRLGIDLSDLSFEEKAALFS